MRKFTIIVDTREKTPFEFEPNDYCDGSVVEKIDYGDYSLKGLESKIFIERKASISEWSQNSIEKRFTNLLQNVMEIPTIKYRYIVCSFSYLDILNFPNSMKVSPYIRKKIKIKSEFISSFTASIPALYNIPIIFFDWKEQAQRFTFEYLKWIWRKETGNA